MPHKPISPVASVAVGKCLVGLLAAALLLSSPMSVSGNRSAVLDAAMVDPPLLIPGGRPAVASSGPCVVLWRPPVGAPVTDGYRPPSTPFGPGNRGLEYGTEAGDPVTAVADGIVRFAGPVGRSRFVVVEHGAGLRSTYGFVETAAVAAGTPVRAGQLVATAMSGFHLTARIAGRYRDPTPLLTRTCYAVRLVPIPAAR